jgi:ParB family chromosome partitioning protein
MTPKKRLGRGLDALLSKPSAKRVAAAEDTGGGEDSLRQIPLEQLQRGQYQPRVDMRQDSLEDLANSIKAQGVVQPIVARPIESRGNEQRYEIVAGERRWRAAQLAGLAEIPAVVREVPDESAIAMALIENIQRENLNPLEEARALDRLIREFDLTHAEAAQAVGRSRASVSNLLRLRDLSDKVKPLLEDRQLEMGHARALLSIANATQQYDAARQIVKKGLSVRETERLVKRMLEGAKPKGATKAPAQNADIRRLEMEVSEKLGAKVSVNHTSKGAGKLVISYNSLDELDGILKHIK